MRVQDSPESVEALIRQPAGRRPAATIAGPGGVTVKIACVGGGPAGLYLALLLRLREPGHDITVFERCPPGVTRGWGVVFWGDLLAKLYRADPESAREIEQVSYRWESHEVALNDRPVHFASSRGYGIKRQRMLEILSRRALSAGVRIEYGHEVDTAARLPDQDLIVACDGMNSRIRRATAGLGTDVRVGSNKYIWLGTDKVFDSFTFPFVRTDFGWIWANAYGIDAESSTFVVECPAETWAGLGFERMRSQECLAVLEKIFARQLDGHPLIEHASGSGDGRWLNFHTVRNERWYDGKIVLAGDAAHTTHFTIGSGTTLALEDAISLADNLPRHREIEPALAAYQKERQAAILHPQLAAHFSAQWFENIPRYAELTPRQFSALLRRRRSPVLPHVPPRLYYWLYPTSRDLPGLRALRKTVGPGVGRIYGWRAAHHRASLSAGHDLSRT